MRKVGEGEGQNREGEKKKVPFVYGQKLSWEVQFLQEEPTGRGSEFGE